MNVFQAREEAAARINALMGVTDDDEKRRARRAIRNAAATASHCGKCERELTHSQPVWRAQVSLGRGMFGGWRVAIAPYCKGCIPKYQEFQQRPKPCGGCGRAVYKNGMRLGAVTCPARRHARGSRSTTALGCFVPKRATG